MIGTLDIKVNAAHPNMPLSPVYTFLGSPQQVRIINVPKQIGNWKITAVQVTVNYPDNSSPSVEATLVGGCWSATLPAPSAVGQSLMGFKVTAFGTDEHGDAITGYVLGKGDAYVLDDDATITVGGTTYYVHMLDDIPESPHKGDLAVIDNIYQLYDGSRWHPLGVSVPEGTMNHSEFSSISPDLNPEESSIGDVMHKLNNIIELLRGTSAALAIIFTLGAFGAVEVQTAKLSTLPGKTMVVTNITGAAAVSDIPTALKCPSALTIQLNGTTAATYDGSAARTVNITTGGAPGATVASAALEYHADGQAISVSVAAAGTLTAVVDSWTDGQSQMAFVTLAAGASIAPAIKLIGYSEWPIGEEFMAVCTMRGSKIYVNPVCVME